MLEFSAGVAEQTFTQSLMAHRSCKPFRKNTKIISMAAIFDCEHPTSLLGRSVPEFSQWVAHDGHMLARVVL